MVAPEFDQRTFDGDEAKLIAELAKELEEILGPLNLHCVAIHGADQPYCHRDPDPEPATAAP